MTTNDTNTAPEFARAEALAGLARQVDALDRRLAPTPQRLDELAKLVDALAETAAARKGGAKVVAPSWFDLPADLDAVAGLLNDLCNWMQQVFLRYPDAATVLPDCWLWHPEVVEELVWLMHTWIAAYTDESASAVAAGDWHDRQRPSVVKRIKAAAGTCSLETHSRPQPVRRVPLTEAADAITTWWAGNRDQPAPVPEAAHLAAAPTEPGWGGRR